MGSLNQFRIMENPVRGSSSKRVPQTLQVERMMTTEETCGRKKAYESRAHAESARRHMSESGLKSYHCPHGNHWHLGRRNR
jgi:hypothetical protein